MLYASINKVYQIVKRIAAKEEGGFISPEDFNTLAAKAQQDVFQSILMEYRMFLGNRQRYLTYWKNNYNSLEAIKDDLRPLYVPRQPLTSSGGNNVYQFPNDYAYYINIEYKGISLDIISHDKRGYYVDAFDSPPTLAHPIAVLGQKDIEMLPERVNINVSMTYYKVPQSVNSDGTKSQFQPIWDYNTVNDRAVFNPSKSRDFELPKYLEYRLATNILQDVGIELRDMQVYETSNAENSQDTQKANA